MIDVYEELSDCSRRRILVELLGGPYRVGDLVARLGLKQPNVSNHLAKLREKGLVKSGRVGREIYYSLATKAITEVVSQVKLPNRANSVGCELQTLSRILAERAQEGDVQSAIAAVDWAIRSHDPLDLYEQVIIPAINCSCDPQDPTREVEREHLSTAVIERVIAHIAHSLPPAKKTDWVAVLGCPEGSWHSLALRMVGDYLLASGWKVLFLGPNTPTGAFAATIETFRPKLVLISSNETFAPAGANEILKAIQPLKKELGFVIGLGGQLDENRLEEMRELGADFYAGTIGEFAREILPGLEKGAPISSGRLN